MDINIVYLKGLFYKKEKFFITNKNLFIDFEKFKPYEIFFENFNIINIIFINYKNNNIYSKFKYKKIKNQNVNSFIKYYKDLEIILELD
tara:strand:- start:5 stop:271 length:267 start_codon:yes stop_codon:yes gene_type:complete